MPATPTLFQYLVDMKDTLIAQGTDTAVLVLAYTLAPEAHYPTQLKQAIELLRHLIETEKRDPSNVSQLHLQPLSHLPPCPKESTFNPMLLPALLLY